MNLTKKNLKLGKYESGFAKALIKLDKNNIVQRIWERDPTVWKTGIEYDGLIKNRLGWLSLPVTMKKNCDEIISFADELRNEGFEYAVVLGMGGSSMCPEVCRETFGVRDGYLKLFVLDSTDPKTIINIENSVDLKKTVFIVSSKSGGTIEVDSFFRYFFDKVKAIDPENAGKHFAAVTDPDTLLQSIAKENNFRKIFTNPADIGGRYSALSYFGLVPAALIGINIKKLLGNAVEMMNNCMQLEAVKNYGLIIGTIAGELSKKRSKRNKLTFILPDRIKSFGYWAEQLIAESTGKEGKGIIPVEGEDTDKPSEYSNDRMFVYMKLGKEKKAVKNSLRSLAKNNFPVIVLELNDVYDLGGQFYLWEFATAVMGCILEINPFDEPNVKESKDNTGEVLKFYETEKKLPETIPNATEDNLSLFIEEKSFKKKLPKSKKLSKWILKDYLDFFFKQKKKGDYIAVMAYIESNDANNELLKKIRELLKSKLKAATTVGFGPRFLHSTGQLHKGGANNGMFIQIVGEDKVDATIPGKPYSFSILKQSQAIGDYESLLKHSRRTLKINIGWDEKKGLKDLYNELKKVL